MLQLSKPQIEALQIESSKRFRKRLCQYFSSLKYNPQKFVGAQITFFVDDAVSKGRCAGLTVEESLQRFSLACWYIGTDAALADRVVADIILENAIGELDKADLILERAFALLAVD